MTYQGQKCKAGKGFVRPNIQLLCLPFPECFLHCKMKPKWGYLKHVSCEDPQRTSNFCLGWCHNESLPGLCLGSGAPRTAMAPVGMGNIAALPRRQDGKSGQSKSSSKTAM